MGLVETAAIKTLGANGLTNVGSFKTLTDLQNAYPSPSGSLFAVVGVGDGTGGNEEIYLSDGGVWYKYTGGSSGAVDSVNGKTGVVVLTASDVGAATAAQGALADTAVQPVDLGSAAYTASTDYEPSGSVATHAALQSGVHGLNIASGKTLSSSNSIGFSGSDGASVSVGSGGTIVYQTRTINTKSLSTDITLTASDVGAPSGSGSSTGTNTGDETNSTIKSKLGAASGTNDGYLSSSDWTSFSGKVSGAASSTDNALVRWDSTTGKVIKNSTVILSDSGNMSGINSTQFSTSPTAIPHTVGAVQWNATDGTLNVHTDVTDVILQVGQESIAKILNKTGTQLLNGRVIYINGAQGNRPTAVYGTNADFAMAEKAFGMMTNTTNDNAEGYANTFGIVRDIDTNGLGVGNVVYLGTNGQFTTTEPTADNAIIKVGIVLVDHPTAGQVFVHIENPMSYTVMKNIGYVTKEPTGFQDPSAVTIAGTPANRTITLTQTGGVVYWYRGYKYTLSSPWTSTAHGTDTGQKYYLSFGAGGTMSWSTVPFNFESQGMVAVAVYDSTAATWIYQRETHGLMPWQSHLVDHVNIGTFLYSGGSLTAGTYAVQPASPTDADNTPGFDLAQLYDEDCPTAIPAWIQGTYTTLRFVSSVATFDTTATLPFRVGTTYPLINTGGVSETETAGNRFFNVWAVYAPMASDTTSQKYRVMIIQPQNSYTSSAAATTETFQALNIGNLSGAFVEYLPRVRITYATSASYTGAAGRCRIDTITYLAATRSAPSAPPATAPAGTSGAIQYNAAGVFGGATINGLVYSDGVSAPVAATSANVQSVLGAASTSTNGYLTSTDWNTFNGKENSGTAAAAVSAHAALQTGVHGISITSGKTLSATNSITLSGTDGSTLNIGTGGTLGSAAYTASTAYATSAQGTKADSALQPGGALGTPLSGSLVNCNGLPVSGITSSTTSPLGVGSLELGHASDTTLARNAPGLLSVEGEIINGFTSTATASGTTTMDSTYSLVQQFTGTAIQTVKLPTSGIVKGQQYLISNIGTSQSCVVTVQSSGANTILILGQGCSAVFTSTQAAPTTSAHWTFQKIGTNTITATSYTTDTGTSLNCDYWDSFVVTAQAGALKLNNPTGTPKDTQKLIVRIKDNGTARALTYDTQFRSLGNSLPSTTVLSKTMYLGFIYNLADTKWDLVGLAQEA